MEFLRKLMKRLKDQAGVTLIELLAVIVILGIIAAIAIPAIVDKTDEAQESVNQANEAIIEEAIKRHLAEGDDYVNGTVSDAEKEFNMTSIMNELSIDFGSDTPVTVDDAAGTYELEGYGTYTVDKKTGQLTFEKAKTTSSSES